MNLEDYFESNKGTGILATADGDGKVDVAVYAKPHFIDAKTVAFIMRDKLSHRNLQGNPCAAYMFIEDGKGYQGKRLYLKKTREDNDAAVIKALRRRPRPEYSDSDADNSFVVYFRIESIRPLVGDSQ